MEPDCYKYCIKLLTIKDFSTFKLKRKLEERGFMAETIEATLKKLQQKNYLNDQNYAEMRIRGLIRKNYGPSYIQNKLAAEKLFPTEQEILAVYQELKISPQDQIQDLLRKKDVDWPHSSWTDKQKLLRFLQQKGHKLEELDDLP